MRNRKKKKYDLSIHPQSPFHQVRSPTSFHCLGRFYLFAWPSRRGASAQTAQWVKQMGTGGISNGVSSDAAGNAYATGTISNPGLFDNITIPCNASDVFLTKYDTSGNILWANVGGGPLLDQGNDIATDANGNSYVVGAIQTNGIYPTAQFGNFILTGHGDYDWLVVKYDTLGNVLWAKNYGSTAGDTANSVGLDAAGNIYVTGFYSGTMTVEGVTVTSKGIFDIFLAKFDRQRDSALAEKRGWIRV